jgi:hypothetical protein
MPTPTPPHKPPLPPSRQVRALVDVPRGSLQLLPYWARVAATLSQCYPEIGQGGSRRPLSARCLPASARPGAI